MLLPTLIHLHSREERDSGNESLSGTPIAREAPLPISTRWPTIRNPRVLRGASYDDNERQLLAFIRFDHAPTSRGANRGFRCAESTGN